MDDIQKELIKAGRKDLAVKYYHKVVGATSAQLLKTIKYILTTIRKDQLLKKEYADRLLKDFDVLKNGVDKNWEKERVNQDWKDMMKDVKLYHTWAGQVIKKLNSVMVFNISPYYDIEKKLQNVRDDLLALGESYIKNK